MIIIKIKIENKNFSFIIFKNENLNSRSCGQVIFTYVKYFLLQLYCNNI